MPHSHAHWRRRTMPCTSTPRDPRVFYLSMSVSLFFPPNQPAARPLAPRLSQSHSLDRCLMKSPVRDEIDSNTQSTTHVRHSCCATHSRAHHRRHVVASSPHKYRVLFRSPRAHRVLRRSGSEHPSRPGRDHCYLITGSRSLRPP